MTAKKTDLCEKLAIECVWLVIFARNWPKNVCDWFSLLEIGFRIHTADYLKKDRPIIEKNWIWKHVCNGATMIALHSLLMSYSAVCLWSLDFIVQFVYLQNRLLTNFILLTYLQIVKLLIYKLQFYLLLQIVHFLFIHQLYISFIYKL